MLYEIFKLGKIENGNIFFQFVSIMIIEEVILQIIQNDEGLIVL
jgi:hypothetical protein